MDQKDQRCVPGIGCKLTQSDVSFLTPQMQQEATTIFETIRGGTADTKEKASVRNRLSTYSSFWGKSVTLELT